MKPYAKTSTKVNGMRFYCCFTVHSHVNMFNNEHSSYLLKWTTLNTVNGLPTIV